MEPIILDAHIVATKFIREHPPIRGEVYYDYRSRFSDRVELSLFELSLFELSLFELSLFELSRTQWDAIYATFDKCLQQFIHDEKYEGYTPSVQNTSVQSTSALIAKVTSVNRPSVNRNIYWNGKLIECSLDEFFTKKKLQSRPKI